MSRMIKWPSIEQFRSVVKTVQNKTRYRGKDENGEAIFDPHAKLPTLKFEGTVKLHGTNASVVVTPKCEFWAQSRENIITPEKDNAGFATFAHYNEHTFQNIATDACHAIDPEFVTADKDLVIFGEWCGKGVQKGVAIAELPKMFVIFGIAFVDAEGNKTYLTKEQVRNAITDWIASPSNFDSEDPEQKIYSIYDFGVFEANIDFENPHEIQNTLNELTLGVEAECPVAKAFGVSGVGEGIVWRCLEEGYEDSGFWFKVKGDKHSNSKVKTLATVDVERINNIQALAEKLAHNGRLEQGLQAVFDTLNGGQPDIKRTGEFIKWVMADIFKEEMDTIGASGFSGKDLNGPVSKLARDFLMKSLEM